jgi:hypothetical protein
VLDNRFLGFSFGKKEWKGFKKVIRSGTGMWSSENLRDGKYPSKLLPVKERYSARHFSLDKVLECVNIVNEVEIDRYYNVGSWKEYTDYLGSEDQLKKPENYLTNGKKLNKICISSKENE